MEGQVQNLALSYYQMCPMPNKSAENPKYLLLGKILRPHGIRGELRVRILTDYPERIAELETIYLGTVPDADDIQPYHLEHMRMHQDYGLLKLAGISDRNEAEVLRDLQVMVAFEDAVPLEEGEFYLFQLIGLTVKTEDGTILGELVDTFETGANDVYIIDSPQHGEILFPAIDENIIKTDIQASEIIVKLPEGLLPS
jgi:16S rRNA processing protein RimM